MAQAGAWVPAASLELTPVDKIFVRMGARDHILTGQVRTLSLCFPGTLACTFMACAGMPLAQIRHTGMRTPGVLSLRLRGLR